MNQINNKDLMNVVFARASTDKQFFTELNSALELISKYHGLTESKEKEPVEIKDPLIEMIETARDFANNKNEKPAVIKKTLNANMSEVWYNPVFTKLKDTWFTEAAKGNIMKVGRFDSFLRKNDIYDAGSSTKLACVVRHFENVVKGTEELWAPVKSK